MGRPTGVVSPSPGRAYALGLLFRLFRAAWCTAELLWTWVGLVLGPAWSALAARLFARPIEGPHVVVVGGGFAGLHACRELARRFTKVTLVTPLEYAEYTPGVLRLFVQPGCFAETATPLPRDGGWDTVAATVTSVHRSHIGLSPTGRLAQQLGTLGHATHSAVEGGAEVCLAYDFLVLATGATYSHPIKPSVAGEPDLPSRERSWVAAYERLHAARSVVVVGGGPVGVELAAEIVEEYGSGKLVTIVTSSGTLCKGFPAASQRYATAWLEARGVVLRLGARAADVGETRVELEDGQVLEADLVYDCCSSRPDTASLVGADTGEAGILAEALDARGAIRVDECLRVVGHERIFAVGDAMTHPSSDTKLAHTAELNARVLTGNLVRAAGGQELRAYPSALAPGLTRVPLIYCLSLGRYDGTLGFNWLVVHGALAALAKYAIGFTKLEALKNRSLANAFWDFGDWASLLLARTLVRA